MIKFLSPEDYANVCHCSLEVATKRCSYYKKLYQRYSISKCPTCEANSGKLQYDGNCKIEASIIFIRCIMCNDTFPCGDLRLHDWEMWVGSLDQVMDVIKYGKGSVMGFEYKDLTEKEWNQFVNENIEKLLFEE